MRLHSPMCRFTNFHAIFNGHHSVWPSRMRALISTSFRSFCCPPEPSTSLSAQFPECIWRDVQKWEVCFADERRSRNAGQSDDCGWLKHPLECMRTLRCSQSKTMLLLTAQNLTEGQRYPHTFWLPGDTVELRPTVSATTKKGTFVARVKKCFESGAMRVVMDTPRSSNMRELLQPGTQFELKKRKTHQTQPFDSWRKWPEMLGWATMLYAYGLKEGSKGSGDEDTRLDKTDSSVQKMDASQMEALGATLDLSRPLIAVHGPPGTGKSLLAAECIHQLAWSGKRVAVLCGTYPAMFHLVGNYHTRSGHHNFLLLAHHDDELAQRMIPEERARKVVERRTLQWLMASDEQIIDDYRSGDKYGLAGAKIDALESWRDFARQPHIRASPVVFAAKGGSLLDLVKFGSGQFDVLVIEEAGLFNEPESWATICPLAPRVRLFGDHCQLARPEYSKFAREQNFGRSLLQRLDEQFCTADQVNFHLRVQYRSHPSIHRWSNRVFYAGRKPEAAESVRNLRLSDLLNADKDDNVITEPLVLVDTSQLDGEWHASMFRPRAHNHSWLNEGEALLVAAHFHALIANGLQGQQIVYFTQHTAQRQRILTILANRNKNAGLRLEGQFERPQDYHGRHFEVAITSFVRDARAVNRGGAHSLQYRNHEMTRARRQWLLVANSERLAETSPELRALVDVFRTDGRIYRPNELLPLRKGQFNEMQRASPV